MGLVSRTIQEGVPTEDFRITVDESECCLNIDRGCAHSQPGADVFVDGVCYDGLDGTLCETCDLSFYESTDFFSSTSADPITFIKNVVDTVLMTSSAQPQTRCCDAGVQLGDAELIQACLTDDGDSEMQLELTDMNECL